LKTGKGLLFILDAETQQLHQFSKHLMCLDTGISYEEPSPNTFSFNSPYGYCPHCKGLGIVSEADMKLIIPNPKLTINKGAIQPLGVEKKSWTYERALVFAKKHKISFTTPIDQLPEAHLNMILFGNPEGKRNDYRLDAEGSGKHHEEYEGIANMIERWIHTTSSDAIRGWAEEYMELKTCEVCQGLRLKKESL